MAPLAGCVETTVLLRLSVRVTRHRRDVDPFSFALNQKKIYRPSRP